MNNKETEDSMKVPNLLYVLYKSQTIRLHEYEQLQLLLNRKEYGDLTDYFKVDYFSSFDLIADQRHIIRIIRQLTINLLIDYNESLFLSILMRLRRMNYNSLDRICETQEGMYGPKSNSIQDMFSICSWNNNTNSLTAIHGVYIDSLGYKFRESYESLIKDYKVNTW